MVVILSTMKETLSWTDELRFFLQGVSSEIYLFPSYNLSPYQFMAYHSETAGRRMEVLYALSQGAAAPIVVTTTGACMQRLIPKDRLGAFAELLMVGEQVDRQGFIAKLVAGGYNRTVLVEEPGDFSVRGGILDIFTPLYHAPLRIEFFDDLVESIRLFSPDTQRTSDSLPEAVVLPAREAVLEPSRRNHLAGQVRSLGAELDLPVTRVRELVQGIKDEGQFSGLENLLPLVYPRLDTLFDYLPDTSLAVLVEPADLERSAAEVTAQTLQAYEASCEKQRLCLPPERLFLNWQQVQDHMASFNPVSIKNLDVGLGVIEPDEAPYCEVHINDNDQVIQSLRSVAHTDTPFAPLMDWIKENGRNGTTPHSGLPSVFAPSTLIPKVSNPGAFIPTRSHLCLKLHGTATSRF